MSRIVHNFDESLKRSHEAEDLPFWEECYRAVFGEMYDGMHTHRRDGEHQRAGVDRSIILTNSKQVLIDEKVRWTAYGRTERKDGEETWIPDFALEHIGNDRTGAPGWMCKPLRADYIAYAIVPKGHCYLLPVVPLQAAWRIHGENWKSRFKRVSAPNPGYNTISVAVPRDVLFPAIGSALRVYFTPIQESPQTANTPPR